MKDNTVSGIVRAVSKGTHLSEMLSRDGDRFKTVVIKALIKLSALALLFSDLITTLRRGVRSMKR